MQEISIWRNQIPILFDKLNYHFKDWKYQSIDHHETLTIANLYKKDDQKIRIDLSLTNDSYLYVVGYKDGNPSKAIYGTLSGSIEQKFQYILNCINKL